MRLRNILVKRSEAASLACRHCSILKRENVNLPFVYAHRCLAYLYVTFNV